MPDRDPVPPPALLTQYPGASVADHEVFLSFNGDSDAELWRDWWAAKGEADFLKWAAAQKAKG